MAQAVAPQEPQKLPFWRTILNYLFDVRVLGVLGQLGFILLIIFGARALGGNFAENAGRLGEYRFSWVFLQIVLPIYNSRPEKL